MPNCDGAAGADVRRYTIDDANHAALGLLQGALDAGFAVLSSERRNTYALAIHQQRPEIALSPAVSHGGGVGLVSKSDPLSHVQLFEDGIADVMIRGDLFSSVPRWLMNFVQVVGYNNLNEDLEAFPATARGARFIVASNGGQAMGINTPAAHLAAIAKRIPTVAHASPAYSGGFWLAAQAHEIMLDLLSGAGSIGAVAMMRDTSAMFEEMGIRPIPVTSPNADEKADFAPGVAVTDEMIARVQDRISDVGDLFQREMAKARGIGIAKIRALHGGIRIGQKAVQAGLVDSIGSLGDSRKLLLKRMKTNGRSTAPTNGGATMSTTADNIPGATITPLNHERAWTPSVALMALSAVIGCGVTETNEPDVVGKITALGDKASAFDKVSSELETANIELSAAKETVSSLTATNADLAAKVAAFEVAEDARVKAAEEAAWTGALDAANVKDAARDDVMIMAKAKAVEGETPADSVARIKDLDHMAASFEPGAPKTKVTTLTVEGRKPAGNQPAGGGATVKPWETMAHIGIQN